MLAVFYAVMDTTMAAVGLLSEQRIRALYPAEHEGLARDHARREGNELCQVAVELSTGHFRPIPLEAPEHA